MPFSCWEHWPIYNWQRSALLLSAPRGSRKLMNFFFFFSPDRWADTINPFPSGLMDFQLIRRFKRPLRCMHKSRHCWETTENASSVLPTAIKTARKCEIRKQAIRVETVPSGDYFAVCRGQAHLWTVGLAVWGWAKLRCLAESGHYLDVFLMAV